MTGRRAAVPVLAWAAFLSVLTTVLWLWTSDPLPPSLFSGAAGIAWAIGLYLLLRPRRVHGIRRVPDLSMATVLVAVAVTLLAVGAVVGLWLLLIGAGTFVLAAGGVGRELLAQRRLR
jgi:hypothetical protein